MILSSATRSALAATGEAVAETRGGEAGWVPSGGGGYAYDAMGSMTSKSLASTTAT